MLKVMAICLRLLASLLRVLPGKRRVALLSRQSSKRSLDYRLLEAELEKRLGADALAVCLTEPESKDLGKFVAGTFRQLRLACSSKVIVVDGYVPAVSIPTKDPKVTVFQMWHAMGAIKKFGYQCLDTPAGRSRESAEAGRMHRNYDYIIAGGPGAIHAFAEAFDYPERAIIPLGLPRTDYLLDPSPDSERRRKLHELRKANPFLDDEKRNVVYAPTLRKGEGYENWLSGNLIALAEQCDPATSHLIVTGHPLDSGFDEELLRKYPQIRFVAGASTIDLLEAADAVISDYSAIIYEAGLLGLPVYLFVPDLEQYEASPGLNMDLIGELHADVHKDAASLMAAIDEGKSQDAFHAAIEAYFEGAEFGATQRIADVIEEALNR